MSLRSCLVVAVIIAGYLVHHSAHAQSFNEIVRELTGDQQASDGASNAEPEQPSSSEHKSLGEPLSSAEPASAPTEPLRGTEDQNTSQLPYSQMGVNSSSGFVEEGEVVDPDFAPQKNIATRSFTLRGLDKKSARVFSIKATIGQVISFGTLRIEVKYCEHSPPEEHPESIAYMQITDEALQKRVFDGWMFASSPSLSALDHKDYDIWLEKCVE